jgi:hypothetical protein
MMCLFPTITMGMFGTASTPKFSSRSWVWSGVVELPKPSSTTLVHFVRELHPAPLPILVELKLFAELQLQEGWSWSWSCDKQALTTRAQALRSSRRSLTQLAAALLARVTAVDRCSDITATTEASSTERGLTYDKGSSTPAGIEG